VWLRTTRLPALIAWILILGVMAYLGTHPRLVAPFASRLVSRNLLRDVGGDVRVGEYRVRYLHGVDLFDVSLTFPGERGGVTMVSIDTLSLDFRLGEVLGRPRRVRNVVVYGAEVYCHLGDDGPPPQRPPPSRDLDWPWLRVDHMQIKDASISVSGPDGRLRESIPSLNWRETVPNSAAGSTIPRCSWKVRATGTALWICVFADGMPWCPRSRI